MQGGGKATKLAAALQGLSPQASNIMVEGAGVAVEVWAVLDPLSKTAQRVAPVLQFLADTLQPSIKASPSFAWQTISLACCCHVELGYRSNHPEPRGEIFIFGMWGG